MGNASLHSFISQPKRKACTLEQSCELTWGSPGINQIKSWKNWARGEVHILKLKFFLCWDFLHIPLCPSPANSSSGTMLFVAAVKQVLPETKDSLTNSNSHMASFYIEKWSVQFSIRRQAHSVVGPLLAVPIIAGEGWWPLSKAGVRDGKHWSVENEGNKNLKGRGTHHKFVQLIWALPFFQGNRKDAINWLLI